MTLLSRTRPILVLLLWVSAVACAATPQFGTDRFIEYRPGELPVVLTSPHGGSLLPASIPDRKEGVTAKDLNTQELTFALSDAFFAATGKRPHVIASHLHRRKLDPNREIKEAAAGDPAAERAWREFHDFIRTANANAVSAHGFAFLIDVPQTPLTDGKHTLGYGLTNAQLNLDDRAFDASDLASVSSLRDLHARIGGSGAELLRGPRSLGTLLAERGVRAIPSGPEPRPEQHPYFSGGYIVQTHTRAADTPKVDGVQFEHHRDGIRDTAANRERFARIAVEVLSVFLRERYRYTLPATSAPAPAAGAP